MGAGHSVSGAPQPGHHAALLVHADEAGPGAGRPARAAWASRAVVAAMAAGSTCRPGVHGTLSPMMMEPARCRRSMVAAWAAASVPAKNGISTWPAFCSSVIAATAAAAASRSRCCGPQPSGPVRRGVRCGGRGAGGAGVGSLWLPRGTRRGRGLGRLRGRRRGTPASTVQALPTGRPQGRPSGCCGEGGFVKTVTRSLEQGHQLDATPALDLNHPFALPAADCQDTSGRHGRDSRTVRGTHED